MNQDQVRNRITIAKWYLGRVKETLNDIQDIPQLDSLSRLETDLESLKQFFSVAEAKL